LQEKDANSSVAMDRALLSHLRMTDKQSLASYAECTPELASDLKMASNRAISVEEIVKVATSKRYTSARVRRGLWHSFLKTSKEAPLSTPHFTNLLAADTIGREYLRSIAKSSEITVITRPSNATISETVMKEYHLAMTADEVYNALHGIKIQKKAPIIK
jgi:predicted nucleotidyltransferase